MAGTDSGAVNERLNGLIALLQSVGIDGVDSDALLEQQKKSKTKSTPKKKTTDSNSEISEILKKLQQAQIDSPEIFEALKSPELLLLASLAAQTKASAPEPVKPAATSLDDVIDDDDDNYPKIGPGYSDDISVISELSTPTVMTRQSVNEEEYYREVKPGGQAGVHPMAGSLAGRLSRATPNRAGLGVGKLATGKTRKLVGQVRPLAARRSIPAIPPKPTGGGAAAQRRLNYQMAMSKLESDGFGKQAQDATEPISPFASANSNPKQTSGNRSIGSGSGGGDSKRKPRSINSKIKTTDDIDWGKADDDGWNPFEIKNNSTGSANEYFVDSDGFFSQSNDGANGAASSNSKSRKKKSDGSTSSGSKKKTSRQDGSTRKPHRVKKERDGERALSDDEREGSTRRSHRLKKEKDRDKDALSDDGMGTSRKPKSKKDKDKDKEKDKERAARRKARRASMA